MSAQGQSALIPSDHLQPLFRLVRRAVRFWRSALATFAVVAALAVAAVVLWPRQYRSETVLNYREGLQWSQSEVVNPRRVAQRLRDLVLSRAQLAKVMEELGLYRELVESGRTAQAVEEMRLAANFRSDQGDVFVISYDGKSPEEAQRVTARLAELLIGENARLRTHQAEIAREFLDAEKKRKAAELEAKEAEHLRFLARHPEFAEELNSTTGATLRAGSRRAEATPARSMGQAEIASLRREEALLRRQLSSNGEDASAPQDAAQAVTDAEAKLAAARRDLDDKRARFTEQHPDLRMAVAMVEDAEAAYRRATETLAAAQKKVPPAVLRQRLAAVEQQIAAGTSAPVPPAPGSAPPRSGEAQRRIVAVETEWARLSREVAEARERFQRLDTEQFMASMTASMLSGGQTAQISVIDPAFLPVRPIGVTRGRLILLSLAVALVLALGVAVVRALLDDLIHDAFDVDRLQLAPVLVEVAQQSLHSSEGGGQTRQEPARYPIPRSVSSAPERRPSVARDLRLVATTTAGRPVPVAAGDDELGAAHLATDPIRALARVPWAQPQQVDSLVTTRGAEGGAGQPASALLVHMAGPAEGATERITKFFSFESDFSELVNVFRIAPVGKVDPRLLMLGTPDSVAAASFRVLRHRVAERKGVNVILVTSPRPGEGKSMTAVNLALALGEAGRARVLLLEANFRTPSLANMIGFEPPVCLGRQLEAHGSGSAEPWIVVETPVPWLHVVAVAPDSEKRPIPDERSLALCIAELRQAGYDYIVVDSPSILDSADVNVIEESVDGIVIALWSRMSRARTLRKAVDQVGGGKVMGVVLLGT